MDNFYESAEYQEIVADAEADALFEVGRPGSEFWGTAIFIILWLSTVAVVWAKENPQR